MKKNLKLGGLAIGIAALLALTLGTTVLAAPGDANADCTARGGYGGHGGQVGFKTCTETVSNLVDLTTEEICELRQDGNSLADIAAANGVSLESLVDTVMADKVAEVEALVADGTITQAQADQMIARMTERIEDMLTRTESGPAQWGKGNGNRMAAQGECAGTTSRWITRTQGNGGMNRWGAAR